MSNVLEKVVDLTTSNIVRVTRAVSMNFCILNAQRCQVIICVCKVLCCFSKLLPVKKLNEML